MTLILASASPRRREILNNMGIAHEVVVSGVEEVPWPGEKPSSYALRNALDKAKAVLNRLGDQGCNQGDTLILAADTIVVLGDAILEKPSDEEHARAVLRQLSGRWHAVMTGMALIKVVHSSDSCRRRELGAVEVTRVRFRALSEAEIAAYVATGEPMDKAGAYAIQGGAAGMVESTEGSHSNVVGLPVERLQELLKLL